MVHAVLRVQFSEWLLIGTFDEPGTLPRIRDAKMNKTSSLISSSLPYVLTDRCK